MDVDEWRDDPVRHRYVHGGFVGTDTRFSFYLPPAERYEGRFFQHLTPVPDREDLAQGARGAEDKIAFSSDSGAIFVETNGGGAVATPGSDTDPTVGAYRAHAAAARYARAVAGERYGSHRAHGYAYGGSGGGYRTIGCAENTDGVWDGFVPYVIGSPMSIPNCFTVRMHAQRMLRDRLDEIVDALEPGGSGDPYATLDVPEAEALREATRLGFPPRSWFGHRTMGMHAFPLLYGGLRLADAAYFDDFWTEPGYLGHDEPPVVEPDVVRHRCEIAAVLDAAAAAAREVEVGLPPGQLRSGVDASWQGGGAPVALVLSSDPGPVVDGADLYVRSGEGTGARLAAVAVVGGVVVLGPGGEEVLARLRPGDQVELDNRGFLAAQTYHRHQVPGPEFGAWDQFRDPDGTPAFPQRPLLLGPLFAQHAAGTVQTGDFAGHMIVVSCLLDREAFPWQAAWYADRVREHLGAATEDRFRLWFVDHALHGDDEAQEDPVRTVPYLGVLHQALRDLSAWVERGEAPAPSTAYEVVDGQVVVPARAVDRRGVQPVASLAADGGDRADVPVGRAVTLRATAEVPPGCGPIVAVEWDLADGRGFAEREVVQPADSVALERTCSFAGPGTHFPAVRVTAQRDGDAATPFARVQDVARARVVVA
ncbi:MAG: hypothetical protein H6518_12925 [Microthrixaceae bacterium]|nr:hypothetical protein [Microthrixaceae bacterium]